jgi:alkylation response protein AidB-like acyl-CoA dehydrogenase
MGIAELNLDLTEEQKALRDSSRKFFMEVWRPAAIALDKMPRPEDVVAKGSVFWDVLKKTYELGYHRMAFPQLVGGMELDPLSVALVTEAMGYASPGLAVAWGVCTTPYNYAMLSTDPNVQGWAVAFCQDTQAKMTGCWAITEPDHGSDWLLLDEEMISNPACSPQVRATLQGDEYVINGQKAAWVSMGTVATHAALFVNLDPAKGPGAGGIAAIPLDLPGISRGKPLDKIGQRDLNQGEIFFDNVRIPKSMMVVADPEMYKVMIDMQLTGANGWMGVCFTGCAHSAYDEALNYARQRVQGGRPIIEHQNIKLKLFEMFTAVEASRSLSRRAMIYNSTLSKALQPPALEYAIASKIFGTETAFRTASQAIQIFGGNGLTREYVIEKIFRDARAAMIEDGVNETLALGGASRL